MIAVIPVRAGVLPLGADETIAECDGNLMLVGDGCRVAAAAIRVEVDRARAVEAGAFAPGAWARALAPVLAGENVIVLPGSADGRDLAPRLAAELDRPLWAGAIEVSSAHVTVSRYGGRVLVRATLDTPAVATLLPGVAGVDPRPAHAGLPSLEDLDVQPARGRDAELLELLPPTAATIDLAEAPRVVAGGAGLGSGERFATLAALGEQLDASVGATRVAVDRAWAPSAAQIGTTGVVVKPDLYIAFGISGAVQHLSGVEPPAHTIAVNTDPSCPMMAAADLAVVADAPAVLDELVRVLAGGMTGVEAARA